MSWHFYYMKCGWQPYTDAANAAINEKLNERPVPGEIVFLHEWTTKGKKKRQTRYTMDLINMRQRQENGTSRDIMGYWDNGKTEFDLEQWNEGGTWPQGQNSGQEWDSKHQEQWDNGAGSWGQDGHRKQEEQDSLGELSLIHI